MKQERLNLNTFGSSGFRSQNCDVVKVWLQKPGTSESVRIDVLSFPALCSPISSEIDLNKYPCLSELEFADFSSKSSHNSIDVLVGSDFYWALVTGEIVKTDDGPVAIGSKLGWLFSGPVEPMVKDVITHTQLSIVHSSDVSFSESQEDRLSNAIKRFWEIETVGTHEHEEVQA